MGIKQVDRDLEDLSRHEMNEAARRIADEYGTELAGSVRPGDNDAVSSGNTDRSSMGDVSLVYRDPALLEFLKRREGL